MRIEVSNKPTETGTYRYDVSAGGRSTHGFRKTVNDARDAAQQDARLMYAAPAEQDDDEDAKESRKQRRRERE